MVAGRFGGAAFRISEQPSEFFSKQSQNQCGKYNPRKSKYFEVYISEISAAILRYDLGP
jgi:hypothetical protein